MRQFKQPIPGSNVRHGLAKGEKARLTLMAGLLVFVGSVIWLVLNLGDQMSTKEEGDLPQQTEVVEVPVYIPEIDVARIEGLVKDADPAERVVLEPQAAEELMDPARRITEVSYDAMGIRELDAGVIAAIAARPAEHRARPFRARGWIDTVRERRRGVTEPVDYLGRLVLADESVAYFLTLGLPEGTIEGDFIRLDGLFLKVFSDESADEPGTWLEGPLLVGARAIRSFPDLGAMTELDQGRLRNMTDDTLDGGITGVPFTEMWHVMAYARDLPADAIDWEAAHELTRDRLVDLQKDGRLYRGEPFRIPVSLLQAITSLKAGENPAREERYTDGWIGNYGWRNVIHFRSPFEYPELRRKDFVTARGFFLKNFAYEPRDGDIHVASMFILTSLERYESRMAPSYVAFPWIAGGVFLALLFLFSILLTRDRRSAEVLQRRLLER
ncbi:MAG: hypothetical protein O7B99_09360, partial [Planctomycetota bacterium]|nr:hypothetical protein [Planctomycetota bacterium]